MTHHVGQRLSLKGQLCTVRYVGKVADKQGEWLGVEWDDPLRGKHNGTHDGAAYFECRSASPTAGSFLRPNQPWDKPRTFMEALKEKYASPEDPHEIIYVSGKQAEEVGFDKFARRQAELRGIHVLVLDHMCIRYSIEDLESTAIEDACKDVTDLDLGSNLFENVAEIYAICSHLPKLRSLTLDGNRFSTLSIAPFPTRSVTWDDIRISKLHNEHLTRSFPNIVTLSLSSTLLEWGIEIARSAERNFPGLRTLVANNNGWDSVGPVGFPHSWKSLDLSGNDFTALVNVHCLHGWQVEGNQVETLILKNNSIATVWYGQLNRVQLTRAPKFNMRELDIRRNNIASWAFFNDLAVAVPNLKHLRTTGNPLYDNLKSAEGNPQTTEDGYMLTIARLPSLETLNFSKITDKERLNAETYYLNQIALEISKTRSEAEAAAVRDRHPRWSALCEEYGEPAIIQSSTKTDGSDPNSLAARLVTITFSAQQQTWTESIPKAANMYSVYGVVGKKLGVMPLQLRLVWETGEWDPVAREDGDAPDWWCSSDEEDEEVSGAGGGGEMVAREVELVAGTRAVGTYIEGSAARVRVEVRETPDPCVRST